MSSVPEIFYSNINYGPPDLRTYWDQIYLKSSAEMQFHINVARKFGKNRFSARSGEWKTPWAIKSVPGFSMPKAEPDFSKSFSEVTHNRAIEIRSIIAASKAQIVVLYSGGIDSTICLVSLIQNLSPKELERIDICMSSESLIENPIFFRSFIQGKFKILDSASVGYAEIENAGNYVITCDQGDSIFGTELATEFYLYNPDVDPEDSFLQNQDKIIKFFELEKTPSFAKDFYDRVLTNIKTAEVSIKSLHDFFWWIIFNLKYMDCALRGPVFYYSRSANREQIIQSRAINWFGSHDYQQWSMANNNNGQKIRGNLANTYKWAGRQFIYQFDKNDWHFRHKLKISSLIKISYRSPNRFVAKNIFGLDVNYNVISLGDPLSNQLIHRLNFE